jgi:hypothetical protein
MNGIRQSQEPILSLALNRVASAGQFPYAPQVREVAPNRGKTGGDTRVTVRGRNFTPDAQVWFGGASAQVQPTSTTTELNVIAPPGSPGNVDIYIMNSNGMLSQQRAVRYQYIDFRLDDIIVPAAGAPLILTGDGFCAETRVVIDGGPPGNPTSWASGRIEIAMPTQHGQQRRVQLINPGEDRTEEKTVLQP